jgi:hypothetical protein
MVGIFQKREGIDVELRRKVRFNPFEYSKGFLSNRERDSIGKRRMWLQLPSIHDFCLVDQEVPSIIFHKPEMISSTNRAITPKPYDLKQSSDKSSSLGSSKSSSSSNSSGSSSAILHTPAQRTIAVNQIIAHDVVDVFGKLSH